MSKKLKRRSSSSLLSRWKKAREKRRKEKKEKLKAPEESKWITAILVGIMLLGAGIFSYPFVADWWNSMHQSRAIAGYTAQVANMNAEKMEAMVEEARAYNRELLTYSNRFQLTDEQFARYNSVLDVTGTGIMGYVKIEKIHVSLPIYHGTGESVLQIAIDHIAGTSLPVGGPGTHCVISGHRGLPSAALFTHIDELEEGDEFTIEVLGETMTYVVDHIATVLPTELQDLEIDPLEDYVTLLTCTPYGINSHRLLVRGRRVGTRTEFRVTADAVRVEPFYVEVTISGVTIVLLFIYTMIKHRKKPAPKPTAREITARSVIEPEIRVTDAPAYEPEPEPEPEPARPKAKKRGLKLPFAAKPKAPRTVRKEKPQKVRRESPRPVQKETAPASRDSRNGRTYRRASTGIRRTRNR